MLGPLLWSLLNAAATVFIPFGLFVVFARTAEAWQVGAVAVAISLAEILKALCPQGLYELLLRRADPGQDRAAFGLLLVSGAAAAAVYAGLLLLVSHHRPDFAEILPALLVLTPKLFFDLATVLPQAVVTRQRALRRLAMRTLTANAVAAVSGSALAVAGHALTGLVLYYLLQSLCGFLLLIRAGGAELERPSFRFGPLAQLAPEATYASMVRLVGTANSYADTLVVASFLSPALVGAYNLGKRIETILITASASFSSMLYQPAFAQGDLAERTRMTETSIRLTTLIFGLPVMLFVAFDEVLIRWAFGPRWVEAAPAAAILAVSGLCRIYGSIHGSLLAVRNRNRALLAYALASVSVGLGAVAALSGYGLVWIAAGVAIKNAVFCGIAVTLTRHDSATSAMVYLRHVILPLGLGLGSAVATQRLCASLLTGHSQTEMLQVLACSVVVGGGAALLYARDITRVLRRVRRRGA
ncbi:PST family polysaccharide transporter [Methylobacterium sp. RAS18]|nr:PST family polysaccharide transporter [Methylobacterium sp. RAS18]